MGNKGPHILEDWNIKELDDFLGSAQVFSSAVSDIIEAGLLGEVSEGQLTVSQLKLLKLVSRADSHTLGDVAAFLGVSNAAASKAVDRLVRRNLLLRTEDERDRRAMNLSVSESGRRLLSAYDAVKHQTLTSVFARFPREELRRISETLDRLSADVLDHSAQTDERCLKCGIYFRQRCLVRQIMKRNCFYKRHKDGVAG